MINGVRKKIRLGDVLIQEGKITQEQLDEVYNGTAVPTTDKSEN